MDPVADVRAYVELTHGMAIHAIAAGMNRRHRMDRDRHEGMVRELRGLGHAEAADAFETLERLRIGRWYGGQGNGHTAHHVDDLLATIEAWSVGGA